MAQDFNYRQFFYTPLAASQQPAAAKNRIKP